MTAEMEEARESAMSGAASCVSEDDVEPWCTFEPHKDLTDVGQYAYCALCAYACGKLFGATDTDK